MSKANEARTRFKNHWWRAYHGISNDSKLAVVALRAGATKCEAGWVWICLLDFASQNENRGSITGLDNEQIGVMGDVSLEKVTAIMAALVSRGMIQPDGTITAWEKRQPKRDRDDTDSAERVRRFREKGTTETPCSGTVTPCNAARGEEIREEKIRKPHTEPAMMAQWEEFKTLYPPHRLDEENAERAFLSREAEGAAIMEALRLSVTSEQWTKEGGRYVPRASKWIAEGAYRDAARLTRPAKTVPSPYFDPRSITGYGPAAPAQANTCNPATWVRIVAGRDNPKVRRESTPEEIEALIMSLPEGMRAAERAFQARGDNANG